MRLVFGVINGWIVRIIDYEKPPLANASQPRLGILHARLIYTASPPYIDVSLLGSGDAASVKPENPPVPRS